MAEEENNQRDTDHGPAGNRGAGEQQLNVVAYAHCAAYSCVVTGICVPVLVGSILLGMVKGPALDGGEIVLIGLQYGVLFFLAAVLGRMSRELGVSPLEAMHRLLVWRVVFLLAAMAWASWDGAGGLVVMGAALTVVLWLGALVEGVCLHQVAVARDVSILGAMVFCMRCIFPGKKSMRVPLAGAKGMGDGERGA